MKSRPFAYTDVFRHPPFFERDGRNFFCYNINKEHILLDEIPAQVLNDLTPSNP